MSRSKKREGKTRKRTYCAGASSPGCRCFPVQILAVLLGLLIDAAGSNDPFKGHRVSVVKRRGVGRHLCKAALVIP